MYHLYMYLIWNNYHVVYSLANNRFFSLVAHLYGLHLAPQPDFPHRCHWSQPCWCATPSESVSSTRSSEAQRSSECEAVFTKAVFTVFRFFDLSLTFIESLDKNQNTQIIWTAPIADKNEHLLSGLMAKYRNVLQSGHEVSVPLRSASSNRNPNLAKWQENTNLKQAFKASFLTFDTFIFSLFQF